MKNNIILICLLAITLQGFSQIKVGKTIMDYEIEYGGEELKMNGAEVRTLYFIDVYTVGLYLKKKSKDPISIAYENETMAIRLQVISESISKKDLFKEFKEGFKKATEKNTKQIAERIKKLEEFYSEKLNEGDILDLVYVRDEGVVCYLNNNKLGVIEGQDFKFALYKIWLGEKPLDKAIKKSLLGKS